ncbi:hypothetical protein D3C87_1993500 [compost metagenome]
MESGEINFFGAAQPDIQYINARITQTIGQGQLKLFTGQPNIAANHNALRFQEFAIRTPDAIGNIVVQLFAKAATNIISFKAS